MELVKKLYDFRELEIPEQLFQLTWSAGEVEETIQGRFQIIREVQGPVRRGDFVVIELPESGELEAKRVQINVGRNFYDAAFEEALVGLEPGAEVDMPQRRDPGRTGKLVQIKRREPQPLSDALAVRLGIEGVETMEDYRRSEIRLRVKEDRRKKTQAIFSMVMREICARSEFEDLTEAAERQYEKDVSSYRESAAEQGRSYEEFLSEFVPPKYETPEQREEYLRSEALERVKILSVGQAYMKETGRTLDQESYEAYKREALEAGTPPDALYPYEGYLSHYPLVIYDDEVIEYFSKRFVEVEKP